MHPILFRLPTGAAVYSYGALLGLSFVVGWELVAWLCRQDGLQARWMRGAFLWTACTALVCSRVLFVVTNPELFTNLTSAFDVTHGGVVAYGGFLGGLLGSWIYCRRTGVSLLAWADCAVPALGTGLMLTRIGCLLAGCDFGQPWNGPLAIQFPRGSPAFMQQVEQGLLASGAPASLPVHPTQVYESLVGLALFGLVMLVRSRRTRRPGEGLAAFTLAYAVLRYGIETLRGDGQRGSLASFSTSQVIALVTFVAGAALLTRLHASRNTGTSLSA